VWCAVQDTIPRGGKFLSAYKRNGQRVVVNKLGDIVVSAWHQQAADQSKLQRQPVVGRQPAEPLEGLGQWPQCLQPPLLLPAGWLRLLSGVIITAMLCLSDVVRTLHVQVRPTPLEASMLQAAWGSNPMHHLLQSYQVRGPPRA
jgi:hypothetical protein